MKHFKWTMLFVSCFALLFTACSQEEDMHHKGEAISLTLFVPGTEVSMRSVVANPSESTLSNVYLLFYEKDAANTAKPVFFYSQANLSSVGTWTQIFDKQQFPLVSGKEYDIYTLASLPDKTERPTSVTTKAHLLQLNEELFERQLDTPAISFSSITAYTGGASEIRIGLVRTVARMDLTLKIDAGALAQVSLNNVLKRTSYFPGGTLSSTSRGGQKLAATSAEYRCYLYETDTNPLSFLIEIIDKEGRLIIHEGRIDLVKKKIERNKIYKLNGVLTTNSFTVTGTVIPWSAEETDDVDVNGVTVEAKANSYIMSPGGGPIYIPVAQANDASASRIEYGEYLSTELVWTDVKGATSGKGLSGDASVAKIRIIGEGSSALLEVTAGSESGNSVVAVRGEDGSIKWSWHIWVTDYNPEQETGQNTSGGYIFMDRNLGAKSIVPNVNGVDVIGNYYQYGRKDPFPTKSNTTGFVTTYNADGVVVAQTAGSTTSAENQIKNPYLWGNLTGYPSGSDLWGEGGDKTINDPCPSGWRVPSNNAFVDLNYILLPKDVAVAGRQGAHTGYYPFTWLKDVNGSFFNDKLITNWTSTAYDATLGMMLRTDVNTSVLGNFPYYRTTGCAVRCVRDWTNRKFEKEVRVLTVGYVTPCAAHQLGIVPSGLRTFVDGLNPLLTENFGSGAPVDVFFKQYNYYNGGVNLVGTDYETIIDLLTVNQIDVLYLPYNGIATPTIEQSERIVKWLDADPHRVLILNVDYETTLSNLQKVLGFTKFYNGQTHETSQLTNMVDSDIYNTLVKNGKYGPITNSQFANVYDVGYLMRDEIVGNGYVPILAYVSDANKISMAIHPIKRILLISDTGFFIAGNSLNVNGSLTSTSKGEYPKLMANMWAWIVETIMKN